MAFTHNVLCGSLLVVFLLLPNSRGFITPTETSSQLAACGSVLQAGQTGDHHFDSPGFPELYPDNVYCFWEISAPTGSRINLTSEYFAVEYQRECLFDYLSIEDGAQGEQGKILFCGHDRLEFVSESNVIKLHFHTDDIGGESGFRILYTAVPPEGDLVCNKTLSEEKEITSPGFPQSYPSQASCFYVLQAPENHSVRLTFTEFHLESYPCHFDVLRVYDGGNFTDSEHIGDYCGRAIPLPVVSSSNALSLKFVSDNYLEFPGFKASVEFVPVVERNSTTSTPQPVSTSPTSTVAVEDEETTATAAKNTDSSSTAAPVTDEPSVKKCNITVKTPSAMITSPGFPREYPLDTVCITKLRSDVISSYLLRFINFTLEESENCTYDFVKIYPVAPAQRPALDVSSSSKSVGAVALERVEPPLRVMCGSVLHQEAVLSWEGLGLDIVFSSDSSVSGTGFIAETVIAPVDNGPQCADICRNGGSCMETLLPDGAIDWKCVCDEGYTGDMCQTRLVPTCDEIICHNGGVCRDVSPEPACACPPGFKGKLCQEWIDPSESGSLYFTKMTGNLSVSVGSSVILECAVSDPNAHVMWLFHDQILGHTEWSRGVEVHPQGVLIIPEVRDEHSGRYTCIATTLSDLVEKSSWLSLTEPCSLHVAKAPRNITIREGQTAMFECYVPDADVILWRKDGDLIESGNRKRILINDYLVVNKALGTDAGQYTCAARASSGCFSKVSAYLTVEASGHNSECGQPRTQPGEQTGLRISKGHQAAPGSAPWHVILREARKQTTFCGGSLISPDLILTAAHCVRHFELTFGYAFDPFYIEIYVGTNNCDGKDGAYRQLKSFTIHEQFNDTHYNNDVAIFKMDRPVEFTDDIMPICLEKPEFVEELLKPRRMGVVTGCGAEYNQGPSTGSLNEIQLPYVARDICEERAAVVKTKFTPGMFCAGYPRQSRGDACQGDSGGPYVMQFHGRSIQVGIVSWGVGCDRENHYGYYTNLAEYHQWILDKINSY